MDNLASNPRVLQRAQNYDKGFLGAASRVSIGAGSLLCYVVPKSYPRNDVIAFGIMLHPSAYVISPMIRSEAEYKTSFGNDRRCFALLPAAAALVFSKNVHNGFGENHGSCMCTVALYTGIGSQEKHGSSMGTAVLYAGKMVMRQAWILHGYCCPGNLTYGYY